VEAALMVRPIPSTELTKPLELLDIELLLLEEK